MTSIMLMIIGFLVGVFVGGALSVCLLMRMVKLNIVLAEKDGENSLAITGRTFMSAVKQVQQGREQEKEDSA